MSDKYIFDEKEVFKPMAKTEFDYEKFYPKLMENYCTALSRIEELESRELGYIQSLRELEARVRELEAENAELKDTLRVIYTLNSSGHYERDWVRLKEIAGSVFVDAVNN